MVYFRASPISMFQGTVFEGLEFSLDIRFPVDYPIKAPTVKFVTPCYHPNVDTHGNICLDILKEKWTASYDIRAVLVSLQSLLNDPNNDSPLNEEAANIWTNRAEFKKKMLAHYNSKVDSNDRLIKN